jgi:serine protease Do
MNRAMVRIAEKVSPAVVQVQAVGYHSARTTSPTEAALVGRQHLIGSGVVVDPEGYILTNNHVIQGAQKVQVLLSVPVASSSSGGPDGAHQLLDATVVGTEPDVDLALLKVEAHQLPWLSLEAESGVRQGEMVFALGSPEGLSRTVTMGVVGAAARQLEAAQPMVYVQTDAPINPGNSGGALVNVDGALVGINTFILTDSGGSQGLGFAIPTQMARLVYEELRKQGYVQLVEMGIATQNITPVLAAALGLPRDFGVIVSDTSLRGVAREGGVRGGDIILAFDGRPIDSLATMTNARYLHKPGDPVNLVLLRGNEHLTISLEAPEKPHGGSWGVSGKEASLVRSLGILVVDLKDLILLHPRIEKGVLVAARTLDATSVDSGLQQGDIIHSVNGGPIESVQDLRFALRAFQIGDAVALQVEREGELAYLSFVME